MGEEFNVNQKYLEDADVFCRFVILWHLEMDLTNCISGMRVYFFDPCM